MVSVSAPTVWKARSVSYSQFVPGKHGDEHARAGDLHGSLRRSSAPKRKASTFSSPCAARTGNTSSSFAS